MDQLLLKISRYVQHRPVLYIQIGSESLISRAFELISVFS